jgi:hypothetical protein
MSASSRVGLVLAIALLLSAGGAVSAHAAHINPDDTGVFGVAQSPIIVYGGVTIVCPESTIGGTSGSGVDPDIDVELQLGPPGECTANNTPVDIVCDGTVQIAAVDGDADTGTARPNEGFECIVTVPFTCSIILGPPDHAGPVLLDELEDNLHVELPMAARRAGTAFCGSPSGTATLSADYEMTPPSLAFDP